MQVAILLLIFGMVAKDVLPIGDVYIMRGVAQALALFVGVTVLFLRPNIPRMYRNAVVFLYIVVLFISLLLADYLFYSFMQVVSLAGPILLFLAVSTESVYKRIKNVNLFMKWSAVAYSLVCIVSLVLYAMNSASVMQHVWGAEVRFSGLFSEPAMMGVSSGLLLGIGVFFFKNRALCVFVAAIAIVCMLLTFSRTFIFASFSACLVTLFLYFPKYRKILTSFIAVGGFLSLVLFYALNIKVTYDEERVSSAVRVESLSNFSGRLLLWETVLKKRIEKPFSGTGFSLGGVLLFDEELSGSFKRNFDPRFLGRTTLHSGYVQALADLGWLGFIVYCFAILMPIYRVVKNDKLREFPILLYSLVFLGVSNIGESVIYTASNFPSIYFWFVAILANTIGVDSKNHMRLRRVS